MSRSTMAIVADSSAVKVAMQRMTVRVVSAAMNSGNSRAIRKTPAATMVAECSRALTGVGPSMASGSQVCSGN